VVIILVIGAIYTLIARPARRITKPAQTGTGP
jgi:hypothetical protein